MEKLSSEAKVVYTSCTRLRLKPRQRGHSLPRQTPTPKQTSQKICPDSQLQETSESRDSPSDLKVTMCEKVLVIGDFSLKGTEAPICNLNNLSREVCCLPGSCICNNMKTAIYSTYSYSFM